ncbi:MAG: hypothetical protein BYD32DRAFT_413309 [Podila humilis]|nr:MAG: hypothetical protein BYD32DRAFT_413309 [Podila humilis]
MHNSKSAVDRFVWMGTTPFHFNFLALFFHAEFRSLDFAPLFLFFYFYAFSASLSLPFLFLCSPHSLSLCTCRRKNEQYSFFCATKHQTKSKFGAFVSKRKPVFGEGQCLGVNIHYSSTP